MTSLPNTSTEPDVESSKPDMQLNVVDFPHPLGPIKPTNSPDAMLNEISSTALRPPKSLVRFET